MILILLVSALLHFLFGLTISADAFLVALAIGLVADATRSNRITQAEAAREALKAYAVSLASKRRASKDGGR